MEKFINFRIPMKDHSEKNKRDIRHKVACSIDDVPIPLEDMTGSKSKENSRDKKCEKFCKKKGFSSCESKQKHHDKEFDCILHGYKNCKEMKKNLAEIAEKKKNELEEKEKKVIKLLEKKKKADKKLTEFKKYSNDKEIEGEKAKNDSEKAKLELEKAILEKEKAKLELEKANFAHDKVNKPQLAVGKCNSTPFGCCADGKTSARSKKDYCKNKCFGTDFGCCPDGITSKKSSDDDCTEKENKSSTLYIGIGIIVLLLILIVIYFMNNKKQFSSFFN